MSFEGTQYLREQLGGHWVRTPEEGFRTTLDAVNGQRMRNFLKQYSIGFTSKPVGSSISITIPNIEALQDLCAQYYDTYKQKPAQNIRVTSAVAISA